MFPVSSGTNLALSVQPSDNRRIFPTNFLGELSQYGVLGLRLPSANREASGDNHTSDFLIARGDTLKDRKALKGSSSTLCLVGKHTTNCTPEHLRWGTVVDGSASGVGVACLAEERLEVYW